MTWSRIKSSGSGKLEFRLVIEGLGYEAVTSTDMEKDVGDGRIRVAGLQRDGIAYEESPALAYGEIEAAGMTVSIVDRQRDNAWTKAFAWQPTVSTWLSGDVATSALVTVPVLSTAGFTAGDRIHIGTEVLTIGTVDSGNGVFTLCVRGRWDTITQAHYAQDGQALAYNEVTLTRPRTIERRRAYLYAYGDGDSLTGDGTLIWRGVCLTDARLNDDGSTWQLTIDPITALLDGDLGKDLDGEPKGPRGVYIPWTAALQIDIEEHSSTSSVSGEANSVRLYIDGHYDDNTDLCTAINSAITTAIASFTGVDSIRAVPDGDDDWHFEVRTHAAAPLYVSIYARGRTEGSTSSSWLTDDDDDPVFTVSGSRTYFKYFADGNRQVPRGYFGLAPTSELRERRNAAGVERTNSEMRIYLDPSFPLDSSLSAVMVKFPGGGEVQSRNVTAVSTTENYIELGGWRSGFGFVPYNPGDQLEVYYSREYATGSLSDFLDDLTTDAPTEANLGQVPFLTTSDIDLTAAQDAIDERVGDSLFLSSRRYVAYAKVPTRDFLAHELRLLGLFLACNNSGQITLKPLRLAAPTESVTASITADEILIDNGYPGWERNKEGSINTVLIKTGYDAREEEHKGPEITVRNVTTFSRMKYRSELEIAPMSEYTGALSAANAAMIAEPVLGVFGGSYAIVSVEVPLKLFDTLCGDTVTLTCPTIPNPNTGGRGVTDQVAVVVGRRWDLDQGRGVFRLLVSFDQIAGYTPSVRITAQTNTSGNTWSLTVATTASGGSVSYFDSADTISDHFAAGDQIRVWKWNNATPSILAGSVGSVTDPGTIVVTFDGAWTPGSDTWILGYDVGTDASTTSTQDDYCYWAGVDAVVDFPTAAGARTYAP